MQSIKNELLELKPVSFSEFGGAAQSRLQWAAVAQFGIGSVRDRKNGLLDGDVVEWAEEEEKSERGN